MPKLQYDYIIIGAGAAGLMLADAMGKDVFFETKSILLLDKETKETNDRTWCFWEKGEGTFDAIVYKKWDHIFFAGKGFSKRYDIAPYTYKMVRGIDFYSAYLARIRSYPNITFKTESVTNIEEQKEEVYVHTSAETYSTKEVLNSIFDYEMATQQNKYPVLQQHFIGWVVKTKKPIFDASQATYMDFSIAQKGNTRFMYILPYSDDTALIEYTLFSDKLLPKEEYEKAIKEYLHNNLDCSVYEILEKEQGSIPMTCYDFKEHHTDKIRFIGTAGGWAKPSTGYTFMSTSKKIPQLITFLKTGRPLKELDFKNRFWYYDLLLLDVLHSKNESGHLIFQKLFKERNPQLIFKFLDEDTSVMEDIYYILGCPKIPFTTALIKRLF
ncbi:lycopene cyclase [Maribacter sp. 4U21]|uniref:lycopene cyclase family protein n=1 Tax=Maribacter sp. 4U21 TaxID=1889779 RepID=UPI000C151AA8|nr:lycopene cyclase family protein [Maribacter sp. 4U21]PIB27613.1 lycopene cyclase [Maribacter sp. 4U21]